MFSINPKMRIQKYPIFCTWYNFFNADVSDFYKYFTAKSLSSRKMYVFIININEV